MKYNDECSTWNYANISISNGIRQNAYAHCNFVQLCTIWNYQSFETDDDGTP
ncbi:uncharacterized protein PHALS_02771 [Plasmopara halstedii]|uniref:Uncharacterized protein n=1 Tax=Plasmopara halstedii TaxID=4781 RepID=A0A0P1AX78_PLAHL|nr:uncharacterized protein PHALS_02771 [Plasmopara halstedii]CEG46368.1 hypothetical protein PHALS_02771 [Plasmopara halstedii]|eukprot:XP_024582737.1 hypothetical protein PHALS_02771 [Plasmopara halstedii]